jgi:hypothetical protein
MEEERQLFKRMDSKGSKVLKRHSGWFIMGWEVILTIIRVFLAVFF